MQEVQEGEPMSDFKREALFLREAAGETVIRMMTDLGAFIAGGAVTSAFSSAAINDFDIFFPSESSLQTALQSLERDEKTIETDSAVSIILNNHRVQLIKAVTGTAGNVIAKFDFTICQAAYDLDGGFCFAGRFLQHLAQRRLVFNVNAEYPICSLYRARKFMKRGFHLSGMEAIKLGLCIQNLKLETFADLKKQLMGIDTLFLRDLTDSLASKAQKHYDLNEFLEMMEGWLAKLDVITGEEESVKG